MKIFDLQILKGRVNTPRHIPTHEARLFFLLFWVIFQTKYQNRWSNKLFTCHGLFCIIMYRAMIFYISYITTYTSISYTLYGENNSWHVNSLFDHQFWYFVWKKLKNGKKIDQAMSIKSFKPKIQSMLLKSEIHF